MKGRLSAPLGFRKWCIFERKAQNDAAIDRASLKLERVAFAVLVQPRCADFAPEGFVALLRDVPSQIVGCLGALVCGVVFAGHDGVSFFRVGLLTPSRQAEGKGSEFMINTAGSAKWCGQTIEDRCRLRSGNLGCLDASHLDQRQRSVCQDSKTATGEGHGRSIFLKAGVRLAFENPHGAWGAPRGSITFAASNALQRLLSIQSAKAFLRVPALRHVKP